MPFVSPRVTSEQKRQKPKQKQTNEYNRGLLPYTVNPAPSCLLLLCLSLYGAITITYCISGFCVVKKKPNVKSKQNRSGSKFMYQVGGHPSRCPTHPSATRTKLYAFYSSSLVRSSIVLRAPFARISIWGSFFVLNGTPCFGS